MRILRRWAFRFVAVGAFAGLTAACETPDLFSDPIILQCPEYFILEDAASITSFRRGPGRDLTDVDYRAQMGAIEIACLSNIDNDTNSGVLDVDVSPIVAVEMGPANESQGATIPFFVAVMNPDKQILYREELNFEVSFAGNRTRLVAKAPTTTLEMPITPEIRERYYLVYGGFALTRDQVEFNRRAIRDRLR